MTKAYEYRKNWIAKHPEEYKAELARRAKRRQERNRQIINEARAKPCMDCGREFQVEVMQFDHVRGAKLWDVSRTPPTLSVARLLEEIAKCEIVCANCHIIRTTRRQRERAERERAMDPSEDHGN